uniref:Uncharacterized protein n=1 Tax=Fagus sylvatica TaxID=28930 RepID=A0A2N9G5C1_FAGSY
MNRETNASANSFLRSEIEEVLEAVEPSEGTSVPSLMGTFGTSKHCCRGVEPCFVYKWLNMSDRDRPLTSCLLGLLYQNAFPLYFFHPELSSFISIPRLTDVLGAIRMTNILHGLLLVFGLARMLWSSGPFLFFFNFFFKFEEPVVVVPPLVSSLYLISRFGRYWIDMLLVLRFHSSGLLGPFYRTVHDIGVMASGFHSSPEPSDLMTILRPSECFFRRRTFGPPRLSLLEGEVGLPIKRMFHSSGITIGFFPSV